MRSNSAAPILRVLCLAVVALAASQAAAETEEAKPKIREFDLKTIEKLGRDIFEQDGYAARATDIVFEKVGGPQELIKQKIAGWIVVKKDNAVVVRFGKRDGGSVVPAYDITFDSPKHGVLSKAKDGAYSANELPQFKARELAIKSIPKAYSRTYNMVVLPDPAGKGFLVYAIAATTEPHKILVGGHYRFSISETGDKLLRTDRLFKSFLVLDKRDFNVPKDTEIDAYAVTHLVSKLPLETHVFLSLLHDKPFVVTTPAGIIWVVADGQITKIDDSEETGKHDSKTRQ
jgi:hypothetical protein